ncbi:tctex1 domain-containing protein 1 [Exaiptasia diaphana]|uniref:Uncharacterized protein n=1 Tax=Exaiptasia diaphana TaxID=2652724 RepID=A0A913XEU9_EXADI|nr:tctex1 domain-containing protein 1 [Exaiptasia diaphana]
MSLRKRSSSSSSLFSIPTLHKLTGEKGNFRTSHYDSPFVDLETAMARSFGVRASTTSIRQKVKLYANTYKMSPDVTLNIAKIQEIVKRNLQVSLEFEKYDCKRSRDISKVLSNGILQEVKMLGMARYRFVCTVTIGELKGQTVRIASRCVWDIENDNFVTESFYNNSLFAVGTVFGIYYE